VTGRLPYRVATWEAHDAEDGYYLYAREMRHPDALVLVGIVPPPPDSPALYYLTYAQTRQLHELLGNLLELHDDHRPDPR